MFIWRNIEARSRIIVAMEKQDMLHICVCVRAPVRACARAHGRVHLRACV